MSELIADPREADQIAFDPDDYQAFYREIYDYLMFEGANMGDPRNLALIANLMNKTHPNVGEGIVRADLGVEISLAPHFVWPEIMIENETPIDDFYAQGSILGFAVAEVIGRSAVILEGAPSIRYGEGMEVTPTLEVINPILRWCVPLTVNQEILYTKRYTQN